MAPRKTARKAAAPASAVRKSAAKPTASKKPAAKKAAAKKVAAGKAATRKSAAKKPVAKKLAGKAAARKAPAKRVAAKQVAKKVAGKAAPTPAPKKPAPKRAEPKVVTQAAAKPAPSRKPLVTPVARKRTPVEAPIRHISPEQAVAHIQALLEAKQERVRQGPTWPGAESIPPHADEADAHATAPAAAGGISSEAAFGHALAHERGEQGRRKG